MKLFRSFIASFSTYSRIPMPHVQLDSEDMKYAMAFFPLVGVVIGALEYALFFLCDLFEINVVFRALIATGVPVIVTGGIHLDGFMDVSDALSSYGDREKKLSIMKDPHTGAFAVIYLFVLEICYIAFMTLVNEKSIVTVCYSFIISRIMSAMSVVSINGAKQSGMIHDVKKSGDSSRVKATLIFFIILVFGSLLVINIWQGITSLAVSAIGFVLYRKKCLKEFGGITGDTSGWYLCIMELILLISASVWGLL